MLREALCSVNGSRVEAVWTNESDACLSGGEKEVNEDDGSLDECEKEVELGKDAGDLTA